MTLFANDYFFWKVLSCGLVSENRTMRILRVAV